MSCYWLGSNLLLIFFLAREFSFCRFSFRERISQQLTHQQLFEYSWKLSVRLCEAYVLKWLFKPWRVQVTQRLSNSDRISCSQVFSSFSQVFPSFAGPRATADQRCVLCIDAQRRQWILKWRRFKPSGNLAPINFKTPELDQKMQELDWTTADSKKLTGKNPRIFLSPLFKPAVIVVAATKDNAWYAKHFGAYFSAVLENLALLKVSV